MKMRIFILMFLLVSSSQGVFAKGIQQSYKQCIDATQGVHPSIMNCIDAEAEFQDQRLNKAYKRLMSILTKSEQKNLLTAQRQWIALSSTDKSLMLAIYGEGDAARMIAEEVYLKALAQRADQLEEWVDALKLYR
ncbi:lysozyme inhibitor LprI family protein [Neisseria sp. Ec49-e6-T10]|uniref:lysozyme inhibitor LprI family protein n=1 Tax=Neisseria sp. Ec49-e6-T10 TaxID=3140744 RepID=UPI003EB75B3E